MNRIDYDIAARTLFGECRGEPEDGQRAVAHVLWNRVNARRWGSNLLQVCLAPYQFSSWTHTDPNYALITTIPDSDPLLTKFEGFVLAAVLGDPDPTEGGLFYYAISMKPPPKWDQGQSFIQIGNHKFFSADHATELLS